MNNYELVDLAKCQPYDLSTEIVQMHIVSDAFGFLTMF